MVASLELLQWFNLEGWLARLQECPVAQQFLAMDFSPRFDKSLLRSRQTATDAFDGIESEHSLQVLVRRMEVRPMVRRLTIPAAVGCMPCWTKSAFGG